MATTHFAGEKMGSGIRPEPSAEPALLGQAGLVLGAQALDGLVLGYFGRRDVPPRPGAGQVDVRDDRDDDDDRALVAPGLVQRGAHVGGGVRPDRAGSQPRRDLYEVDLEIVAVQPGLAAVLLGRQVEGAGAVAELVAELAAVAGHLQAVDHLIAVVLRDHHRDGDALLHGGDQLGRRHQERAVTDEHHYPRVRVRVGEPDAHTGRDLITHTGEPELQVAEPALRRVPHLLQVTGRPTGRGHDGVAGTRVLLQQPDDLALGE